MALSPEQEKWRRLSYVSMRLARTYLQWLEGTSDLNPVSTRLKIPFGDVAEITLDDSPEGLQSAMHNPFLAARTLNERLHDVFIDLASPDVADSIVAGRVVKAELLVQPAHLQIQDYELIHPSNEPYYVVAFASVDQLPGLGRVFVGLVGSEYNLLSRPGDGTIAARPASDARGLYEMVQYTKEANDIDISPERYRREFTSRYEDVTEEERIRVVAEAFSGYSLQHAPRPMEMLFEVHHVARNIELESLGLQQFGKGRVALAMTGAPIWIRESTDQASISASDVGFGPERAEALWATLDEKLNAVIRDPRLQGGWTPRSAAEWHYFGTWAVAYTKRVGPDPIELAFYPTKFKMFGREFGGRADELELAATGWLTDYWGVAYFLSREGEVFVAVERDERAFFIGSDRGSPIPVDWDDFEVPKVVEAIFARLVTWLTPFGPRS